MLFRAELHSATRNAMTESPVPTGNRLHDAQESRGESNGSPEPRLPGQVPPAGRTTGAHRLFVILLTSPGGKVPPLRHRWESWGSERTDAPCPGHSVRKRPGSGRPAPPPLHPLPQLTGGTLATSERPTTEKMQAPRQGAPPGRNSGPSCVAPAWGPWARQGTILTLSFLRCEIREVQQT